jgi:transcriptional regulator with XRE-family HTH domain
MKKKSARGPRPISAIDRRIAKRIRLAREAAGQTQKALAKKLGIAFQQVHKYEAGTNRISAGRLYEVSRVLQKPVTFFFEGLGK